MWEDLKMTRKEEKEEEEEEVERRERDGMIAVEERKHGWMVWGEKQGETREPKGMRNEGEWQG